MSYLSMTKYKYMLALAEFDKSLKKIKSRQEFSIVMKRDPLKKAILTRVGRKFRFTNDQFALVAGVTTRTYQRQLPKAKISLSASENTLRLAEVYKNGLLVFDDDKTSFQNWLNASVPALNNNKPIELITTGLGAEAVNDELLRMEYGGSR